MSLGLGGHAITASNLVWQQMRLEAADGGADPGQQGAARKRVIRMRARSMLTT
jgi:hypothetical protein